MTFLFPGVEMARREALAKINGMRKQMDEAHEAEQPIRALISELIPLVQAAESVGPVSSIEIPGDRLIEIRRAKHLSDMISNRPIWNTIGGGPDRLFGYPLIAGAELRIVSKG